MQITELYIRGYGIFQECRVQDIPAGLSLFLGDNEAGKSTCLGFIRDVLFGAPDGRSREKTYPALRGGRWGGSLGLACQDRGRLLIERGPGPRGGRLTVTSSQGQNLSPEVLDRILGGTTREVFKNIYAFSLSELQTLETLNSDRVRDVIYSAGLGAGLSSLPEALKELEVKKEKLFKVKGQNQTINALLGKIEEVRTQLRQASGDIAAYDQIVLDLQDLSSQREQLKQDLSSLQGRISTLSSMKSRWEEWVEYQEISRELHQLPRVTDFPDNGLQQYTELADKLEQLQERRAELAQEVQVLQERLQALVLDQGLLEQEELLQALAEDKGRFVQAGEDLHRLKPELKARQESLQAVLRRLGQDWEFNKIKKFDSSLQVKENLDRFAKSLSEQENLKQKAKSNFELRVQELARVEQNLQTAKKELAAWGSAESQWDQVLAEQLRRERDRFAQALADLPAWKQQYEQSRRDLERILAEINPGWARKDLQHLDTSLQVRESLDRIGQEFNALEREQLRLEQELRTSRDTEQTLQEKQQELSSLLEDLEEPGYQSLEQVRAARAVLQELRQKTADLENIKVRLQALQGRLDGLQREARALQSGPGKNPGLTIAGAIGTVFFLVIVLLAIIGIISWSAAWLPAASFGLLGCSFWGLAFKENKNLVRQRLELSKKRSALQEEKHSLGQELNKTSQEKQDLEQKIQAGKKKLGLAAADSLQGLEAELDQAQEILQQRKRLQQELQGVLSELQKAQKKTQALQEEHTKNARAVNILQEAWQQQLQALDLNQELTPGAAMRILDRAETARSELAHLQEAETRLEALQTFVQDYSLKADRLVGAEELSQAQSEQVLSAVDRYLQLVDQEVDRLRHRDLAQKELDRKSQEHDRSLEAQAKARQELQQAEQDLQSQQSAWRSWLQELGLSLALSPELAREALTDIQKAQELLAEQQELQDKLEQNRKQIEEFSARVRGLAQKIGRQEPPEHLLLSFVQSLSQELEKNRKDSVRGQELQDRLQEKRLSLQDLDNKISQLQQNLQSLLEQTRARDEQEFLKKGRTLEKTKELQDRLQSLASSLMRGSGYSEMQTVQGLFAAWNKPDLEQEIHRLEQDIEDKETQRQEISSRIGELQAEINRLASADHISRLRQEEEFLREELQQAALRWSKYTLAQHLLRQAKSKFEQEQQPQVLRTAGKYLQQITAGAYSGVFAPLGQGEVYALDALGQPRSPEDLSRGTAEQLYLALRFGYVHNAGQHGQNLPVIMDDILVNFDPARARSAAQAIHELAGKNQVLYFTCHPRTLELLHEEVPGAAVFELCAGQIKPRPGGSASPG